MFIQIAIVFNSQSGSSRMRAILHPDLTGTNLLVKNNIHQSDINIYINKKSAYLLMQSTNGIMMVVIILL